MTGLVLLCWLALALPGAALVRRAMPAAWGGGLLSMLGIGWMATFILLAPLLVVAYVLRWPVGAVAVVAMIMACAAGIDLARACSWRRVAGAVPMAMLLAAVIVVADAVLAERLGAILDNDARVHVARIRFVLDHGLSNADPFVRAPIEHPYPIYHTNLLHALHAMVAWSCGIDPLDAWYGSLGASRLLVAGAAAWGAWAVLGGRWAPWIAAVMAVLARIGIDYTPYPNQLAPWFALPVVLGAVALILGREVRFGVAVAACAGLNLVVAMIHPLYAGFVLVMLGPVLVAVAVVRTLRRIGRPALPLACLAGLMLSAVPMLVAVRAMTAGPQRAADVAPASSWERAQARAARVAAVSAGPGAGTPDALGRARQLAIHRQDGFTMSVGEGRVMIARDWGRGFTGGWSGIKAWRLWSALAALLAALALLGRPQALVPLGSIVVVLLVMSIPPICTAAIGFLGAQWMILRFEALAGVAWCMLAIPAMAAVLERWTEGTRLASAAIGTGVTVLAVWIGMANFGTDAGERLERWWDRSMASAGTRSGVAFDGLVENRRWMERVMPKEAVVACGRLTGTWAAMLRGPRLVASERSSTGVPSGAARTRHTVEMLDDSTDEERRAELFRHYGVTHALLGGRLPAWAEYWSRGDEAGEGHRLIALRDAPDPTKVWERRVADASRDVLRGCADRAEPELLELVGERPASWRAWYALGNAQWELGHRRRAEASYHEAQRLAPVEAMPALMLGNCAESLGRPLEAIECFQACEGIALAEGDRVVAASANFNRANVLRRIGRLAEAEDAYRRAMGLDPMHPRAREEVERSSAWLVPGMEAGVVGPDEGRDHEP